MFAQFLDATAFTGGSDEKHRLRETIIPQRGLNLRTHLFNSCFVHAVGFRKCHGDLRITRQLQNLQMLTRLRHHAVITRHHQQRVINPANTRQHVRQKLFVSGYIDKSQYPPVRLRTVGIAEIDGHAALFFFRQTVGIHAGNRL